MYRNTLIRDHLNRFRKRFALLLEHTGLNIIRRIAGQDGTGFLKDDWAGVIGLVSEVDGTAGDFATVVDDCVVNVHAVHTFATERRQQCGVNIDDLVRVIVWYFKQ